LKDVAQQVSKVNQAVQSSSREETREQAAANFINQKSGSSSVQERGFAR
jgi:hypothetical protein